MELGNELCNIIITVDETYTIQSVDNKYYDYELNPEGYKHNDYYKVLSIHIDLFYEKMDIALIGDYYSYDDDCAVLDVDKLTIMQNDQISQICVSSGRLLFHKKFECFGCNFGLYSAPNGFVVYGEIEITYLNLNFDKIWGFSGKDIFVSQTKNSPFELCQNSIKLYDWEDNYYELDYDGNIICERQSKK